MAECVLMAEVDLAWQRCAAPDEPAAPHMAASALTVWLGECDQLSVW